MTAPQQIARTEEKLRRELGQGVLDLIEDPRTEDVCLNDDGSLWVCRQGGVFVPAGKMSKEQAYSLLGTIASLRQTVINHERPILETELPFDEARFEGIVPPVVRGPVFAIRILPKKIFSLEEYESAGILTRKDDPVNTGENRKSNFAGSVRGIDHLEIIRRAVRDRQNILVVGPTGSGKTTLGNAVLDSVAKVTPNDRIVLIEDTIELQCAAKNVVALRAGGNVSLDDCVRASLRLRPTRIVVGEVRGGEALHLLKSWATGHPGGIATIHGRGALAGLIQLENLVAEATRAPKQALIAETIQLVIVIDQEPSIPAGRKIREVAVVNGYENGRYNLVYV